MIRQRKTIVDDRPGITRDRVYAECDWNGREFILVDTGGFVPRSAEIIPSMVTQQVMLAIDQADVVLFALDTRVGLQTEDEEIAALLKRGRKTVVVAANKADSEKDIADATEFYKLGLGEVYPVSAAGGRQIGELLDVLVEKLPPPTDEKPPENVLNIAIVGRPNVGKSSLFNAMVGEKRQIVTDIPGTTRDSVDQLAIIRGRQVNFVDTAGLRLKSRYPDILEYYSSLRSIRAMERADIVLVVLDIPQGATTGDARIAGDAEEMGRGIILVANMFVIVTAPNERRLRELVYETVPKLRYVPVVFTSAVLGKGIDQLLQIIFDVEAEMTKRVNTAELNEYFEQITQDVHPPAKRGRLIKFYYITQTDKKPPTFVIFSNHPKLVDAGYRRYLENRLREKFGFRGTPINLIFKARH